MSQQTIRNWSSRFEERPFQEAPFDEQRGGRPRKSTDEEQEQLVGEFRDSPQVVGFEQQAWFPLLVYHHLQSKYVVEYSLHHMRRLMCEAGLSWRTERPQHPEIDPEQAAEFQETAKKNGLPMIEEGWLFVTAQAGEDRVTARVALHWLTAHR